MKPWITSLTDLLLAARVCARMHVCVIPVIVALTVYDISPRNWTPSTNTSRTRPGV